MPSFFPSGPKKAAPIFAGLDDPFNFPSHKLRYPTASPSTRTRSPDTATDSGYSSLDSDSSHAGPPRHKRRLHKDLPAHGRTGSYEYQSQHNDDSAERQPILHAPRPDNAHAWRPDPRRTFSVICKDQPAKGRWFARRVYCEALARRERSDEGVTQLQRDMAPVIRRAAATADEDVFAFAPLQQRSRPSASPGPGRETCATRPPPGTRKKSTLLHPSSPPPPPPAEHTNANPQPQVLARDAPRSRTLARARKPSTLLHPSPAPSLPLSVSISATTSHSRSPSAPTLSILPLPLISPFLLPSPRTRRPSVLHSCFSESEHESESESEPDTEPDADADAERRSSGSGSIAEIECEGEGDRVRCASGIVVARRGVVARAQRVRVGKGRVRDV